QAFGQLGQDLDVGARAATLILDTNLINQVAPDFDWIFQVHDLELQSGHAFDVKYRFGLGLTAAFGLDDGLVRLFADLTRLHPVSDNGPTARRYSVQSPGDRAGRHVPRAALARGNEIQAGRQRVHDLDAGRDRRTGVGHFQFESHLALHEAFR